MTAVTEKEDMLVAFVAEKIGEVIAVIDEDGGGTISKDEFALILENDVAIDAMQEIGVDVLGLADCADWIFGEGDEESAEFSDVELSVADFMDVIWQLRGSNCVTVKDIVE